MSSGQFDGTTTYGQNFVGHELEKRAVAAPPPARPQGKFEGTTAYHDNFVKHAIEPRCAGHRLLVSAPRLFVSCPHLLVSCHCQLRLEQQLRASTTCAWTRQSVPRGRVHDAIALC